MKSTSTSTAGIARARSARKIERALQHADEHDAVGVVGGDLRAQRRTHAARSAARRAGSPVGAEPARGHSASVSRAASRNSAVRRRRPSVASSTSSSWRRARASGLRWRGVRQEHLAEQHGLPLGERAVHAEMARFDAPLRRSRRRHGRDLERVVVEPGLAALLAGRAHAGRSSRARPPGPVEARGLAPARPGCRCCAAAGAGPRRSSGGPSSSGTTAANSDGRRGGVRGWRRRRRRCAPAAGRRRLPRAVRRGLPRLPRAGARGLTVDVVSSDGSRSRADAGRATRDRPGGSSSRRSLITFSGRKCSFCWWRIQRSRTRSSS